MSKKTTIIVAVVAVIGMVSFPVPFPHPNTRKVHAGLSRWQLSVRLSLWQGHTPVPVSYTHLDVYKRQLQCSRTMRYALSFPYHRESIFLSSVISA